MDAFLAEKCSENCGEGVANLRIRSSNLTEGEFIPNSQVNHSVNLRHRYMAFCCSVLFCLMGIIRRKNIFLLNKLWSYLKQLLVMGA